MLCILCAPTKIQLTYAEHAVLKYPLSLYLPEIDEISVIGSSIVLQLAFSDHNRYETKITYFLFASDFSEAVNKPDLSKYLYLTITPGYLVYITGNVEIKNKESGKVIKLFSIVT